MMRMTRNHTGHRVGECHQKAKLTDKQVREMRHLRNRHGVSYLKLSERFGCGVSTVRDICRYWTRASA